MQKNTVRGLTTAAGIWATAGIGMAVGAGMYFIGIGVMIIIVIGQLVLHGRFNWLASPKTEKLLVTLDNDEEIIHGFMDRLSERHILIVGFEAERKDEEMMLRLTVQFRAGSNIGKLLSFMEEETVVKKMKIGE